MGEERSSLRLILNNKRVRSNRCEPEVTQVSKKQCRVRLRQQRLSCSPLLETVCYLMIRDETLSFYTMFVAAGQNELNTARQHKLSRWNRNQQDNKCIYSKGAGLYTATHRVIHCNMILKGPSDWLQPIIVSANKTCSLIFLVHLIS